ncbi:MAG: molybdenum cofactor guanylyltransferase [Actinomycetota bacterium]|nr:molybdenum cofactor guanylyltransferase [Actinomycetota bacterium]
MNNPGEGSRSHDSTEPIGVILAGGRGARIGGAKATVELHGRPLIAYPFEVLASVLAEVVVITKSETELPSLPGATVWVEPHAIHHPLIGIIHALGLAGGRQVLICAADLPFVTAEVVRLLVEAELGDAPALIVSSGGRIQPLLGRYQPKVTELLAASEIGPEVRVQEAIAALGPRVLELDDPDALFNVNSPDDLLQAAAMLDRRRGPKAKP